MRVLPCPHCSTNISTLEEFTIPALAAIVHARRTTGTMQAIALLRESGYEPWEAKASALHIPIRNDTCHRCNGELAGRGPVYCGTCRSLNLNRMDEQRRASIVEKG